METDLSLADEGRPKHYDTLGSHADFEVVILLEPIDDLLQGGISRELESIPQCPLHITILQAIVLVTVRHSSCKRQRAPSSSQPQ